MTRTAWNDPKNVMDHRRYESRNSIMESEAKLSPSVSSPEMFVSDTESEVDDKVTVTSASSTSVTRGSPHRPSQADLITKSDNHLLARINKFLSGVPPPPRLTICRSDYNDFLLRICQNKQFFWTACPTSTKDVFMDEASHREHQEKREQWCRNGNQSSRNAKSTPRNLASAFDACDVPVESSDEKLLMENTDVRDNLRLAEENTVDETLCPSVFALDNSNDGGFRSMSVLNREDSDQRDKYPKRFPTLYRTIDEMEAMKLSWPEAYRHKCHGIHYNRNKAVEEYENLSLKLYERYVGAETQSTCNVWFSKQTPGSARKRSLLAKRETGQSPGKRLSHLARRRRTFSSANLQGLGLVDKKQLVLNVNSRKTINKKGKSPRGKSPRGSAKKRVVRRLALDGPSPRKARVESSKRALFQSPPTEKAGPSKPPLNGAATAAAANHNDPQNIKRALFPTPKKQEDEQQAEPFKKSTVEEETKKRKREDDDAEGPRYKWAKSLSFDCTHEFQNNSINPWGDQERNSSGHVLSKGDAASIQQNRTELSDAHRKKLLWAVAEALRSKGIGMAHPRFKQYASNLARTVKKFMPDLENRNVPRKPGSTSDRMLKLAKYHVLFVMDSTKLTTD